MENMSKYRPITNLNTIGMILERLAMKQMRHHMENSPNLGPLQSVYRALHSNEMVKGGKRFAAYDSQQIAFCSAVTRH